MPVTLARPRPAPRPEPAPPGGPPRPLALAGPAAAFVAAAAGLLVVEAIVLLLWAGDPRSAATWLTAVRVGADLWLLAHDTGLRLPDGYVGLVPLGLTALPALLCLRAGRRVARDCYDGPLRGRDGMWVAVAVGLPYGLLGGAVAVVTEAAPARPVAVEALLGAAALGTLAAFAGARRAYPAPPWSGRLPGSARAALTGGAAALAALAAGGALAAGVALGLHAGGVAGLARDLRATGVGGVGLLLTQLVLLPNAAVWSVAYCLGPGFAVGADTSVTPFHVRLGDLPAVPMLVALPGTGRPGPLALLVLAVPLAAGIAVGAAVHRRAPGTWSWWRTGALALGTGPLCGAGAALASWLSGGPVGPDRLATVGPSPWQVGLAATTEVAFVAAVAAAVARGLARRRDRPAGAAADRPPAGDVPRGQRRWSIASSRRWRQASRALRSLSARFRQS